MSEFYADPFAKLIGEFQKMPGIGPKSAQRLSFYVLGLTQTDADRLAGAISEAKRSIKHCSVCFNLAEEDTCRICSNGSRDRSTICVVSDPKDLIAIEKTREYKGLYHVLGGLISPLDGMGPDSLRVKELLGRIGGGVREVILALNPSTEGEATSMYLTGLIGTLGAKVTRIAYGLPVGSDMDYADEVTLCRALEGRRELKQ